MNKIEFDACLDLELEKLSKDELISRFLELNEVNKNLKSEICDLKSDKQFHIRLIDKLVLGGR